MTTVSEYYKLEQEIKRLKAELERVSDSMGNELQEKYLEIEDLKIGSTNLRNHIVRIEQVSYNLKEKLSKIEALTESEYYGDGMDLNNELKAILEEHG